MNEQIDNIGPEPELPAGASPEDDAQTSGQGSRDAIEKVNQQNRVLRETWMIPPHATLTEEQASAILDRYKTYIEEHGIKPAQVAREVRYSPTVLSQWAGGTYKGNVSNVARAINDWMELDARRRQAKRPSDYVPTWLCEDMRSIILLGHQRCCIVVLTAPSGSGKTKLLRVLAEPLRAVHVTCTERMRLHGLYLELAKSLGFAAARGSSYTLEKYIIERLRGTGRIVFIDEAHLIGPGIKSVRSIHDGAGVPIVLVGTDAVEEATDDSAHGRGQFSSRCIYYNALDHAYSAEGPAGSAKGKDLFTEEEIRLFFASQRIRLDREGFKMLWALACLPGHGCLRLVERIVDAAYAINPDADKLTRDDLLAAMEMIASRKFVLLQRLANRQMERWDEAPATVAAAG